MTCATCVHRFQIVDHGAKLDRCQFITEAWRFVGLNYPCRFEPSKWAQQQ